MPVRDMQFDAARIGASLYRGGERDEQRVTPANESELMLRYTIKRDAKKRNKTKQLRPCGCCKGDALNYRRWPYEQER